MFSRSAEIWPFSQLKTISLLSICLIVKIMSRTVKRRWNTINQHVWTKRSDWKQISALPTENKSVQLSGVCIYFVLICIFFTLCLYIRSQHADRHDEGKCHQRASHDPHWRLDQLDLFRICNKYCSHCLAVCVACGKQTFNWRCYQTRFFFMEMLHWVLSALFFPQLRFPSLSLCASSPCCSKE